MRLRFFVLYQGIRASACIWVIYLQTLARLLMK